MKRFVDIVFGMVERISCFLWLLKIGLCNILRVGIVSDKGVYIVFRLIYYVLFRCIIVREVVRFYIYLDWFQFYNIIWYGFWEIGNFVVFLLVKVLGEQVMAVLNCFVEDLLVYELEF